MHYHNKHLIGYFESRYGSRIISLPLNISEKLHWQCVFEKLEKGERNNMRHPEEQHLPFKQIGTIIIFSSGYQSCNCPHSGPFCWQNHALVVTVELIWLLFLCTLSFKFAPAPRKSLRFTRFRRSYVNHPALVLTNYCQSYTAFFAWCALFNVATFLFVQLFVPNDRAFAFLSTPVARMLVTLGWICRRTDVK